MSAAHPAPLRAGAHAPLDAAPAARGACCRVVELRRYALVPGSRDRFVDLFDRELVAPQEATGMRLLGQFRDVDRPDAFVWLRGFPDMASRRASLHAFYDGPAWAAHRDAANGMMLSFDDVRLLRPVRPGAGLALGDPPGARATTVPPRGLLVATVLALHAADAARFPAFFEHAVVPRLDAAGAPPIAAFETEPAENTFPRLPVREGEHAFVWLAWHPDVAASARVRQALARDARWRDHVEPALGRMLRAPGETWRLAPTARSAMPR